MLIHVKVNLGIAAVFQNTIEVQEQASFTEFRRNRRKSGVPVARSFASNNLDINVDDTATGRFAIFLQLSVSRANCTGRVKDRAANFHFVKKQIADTTRLGWI